MLNKVLSLGPKGLNTLLLYGIPSFSPIAKTLIRTISNHNFYIKALEMDDLDGLQWEDQHKGLSAVVSRH